MNFENISNMAQPDAGGKTPANFPLARQSSIYSMTFDELQTMGGLGKDFGSMNMEDLLKNIWTAEEPQVNATTTAGAGTVPGGNLLRQGSLTLPRTLSQRTVDEVWKDFVKESGSSNDRNSSGAPNLGPRQPTLGEMTLEEFLVRAGVVREEMQQSGKPCNLGFYGGLTPANGNNIIGFQQPPRNDGMLLGNQIGGNNHALSSSSNLLRSSHPQHQQSQPNLQPLFPKQTNVPFASSQLGNATVQHIGNGAQLASPGAAASVVGMANASMNNTMAQSGVTTTGVMGMAGLRGVTTSVAGGSPGSQFQPDSISKSSLDTSSLSPSPYGFNEGGRGRRSCGSLEKQVERRRRRMIKNRESAARSRARKQVNSSNKLLFLVRLIVVCFLEPKSRTLFFAPS